MDSSLIAGIVNLGFGGAIVVLMILGYLVPRPSVTRLLRENEELKRALDMERQRSDDAHRAASVTSQIVGALYAYADGRAPGAGVIQRPSPEEAKP